MLGIEFNELDLLSLPFVSLSNKTCIPAIPAVYLAVDSNAVVQYVGMSSNLAERWVSHHRFEDLRQLGQIRIAYISIADVRLLSEIEKALIDWYQPSLNGRTKNIGCAGENIVRLRKERSLTQRQVATAIGVTDQAISNWERGKSDLRLTASQWLKLINLFDCSPSDLASDGSDKTAQV